ncbi:MAG: WXG100 family type VII secretion target [Microbacteriaceae bacterium]
MANLNVTYDEIKSAANQLTTGKENLITELNQLKAQIDNLVSSGFVTDAASGAFQTMYEQFTTGTTQTVSALDGISTSLSTAADTFSQADSQIASSFSS